MSGADLDIAVHSKRLNSATIKPEFEGLPSNKRAEYENLSPAAAADAAASKAGRRPLLSEPKDKRTAQNRAAQRAYRERKERRLKELEDKVLNLEDEKLELHNESEFLRIQVEKLARELRKFREDTNIQDFLPQKVAPLKNTRKNSGESGSVASSSSNSRNNTDFSRTLSEKSTPASLESGSKQSKNGNRYHANISVTDDSRSTLNASEDNSPSTNNNPGLTSSGQNDSMSSCSSSISTTTSPNELQDMGITSSAGIDGVMPLFGQASLRRSSILSNELPNTVAEPFDEKVTDFCLKLSEACGSKACPIPKSLQNHKTTGNTMTHTTSNADSAAFTHNTLTAASPFNNQAALSAQLDGSFSPFNNLIDEHLQHFEDHGAATQKQNEEDKIDPYALLNETPFDPSTVFDINDYDDFLNKDEQAFGDNDGNDISKLVTEESLYDPLGMSASATAAATSDHQYPASANIAHPNELNIFSPPPKESSDTAENILSSVHQPTKDNANTNNADDDEDDANAVVPSNDGQMLNCSAVWDRITSHPRYTEVDIEGLCWELKQKAKCSERGAVVSSQEVSKLLDENYLIKSEHGQKNWFM